VSTIYVSHEIWSAIADANGYAQINNLRPGKQRYAISAKGWNVPVTLDAQGRASRELNADIAPGQIAENTVTMEPAPPDAAE
jgi:hypothetical protein